MSAEAATDQVPPETSGDSPSHGANPQQPDKSDKVTIIFQNVGNAPIIKKKKWNVGRNQSVAEVVVFIKKVLKYNKDNQLFLFIAQNFTPSMDQTIGTLYDCFGHQDKLVMGYCTIEAWG